MLNLNMFRNDFAFLMSTTDAAVLSAVGQLWGITTFGVHPHNSLLSGLNEQQRIGLGRNLVKFKHGFVFLTSATDAAGSASVKYYVLQTSSPSLSAFELEPYKGELH